MTTIKRLTARLLLPVLLAALGLGLAATPAQAAYAYCRSGTLCLYTGTYGGGLQYTYYPSQIGACTNMTAHALHVGIHSYLSLMTYRVRAYFYTNCNGPYVTILYGYRDNKLSYPISSVRHYEYWGP